MLDFNRTNPAFIKFYMRISTKLYKDIDKFYVDENKLKKVIFERYKEFGELIYYYTKKAFG